MEPVPVVFDQLTKRFEQGGDEIVVLDRVSLKVQPAEFVAMMGPSGSGKSTLLNLIAGLDKPTSGKVTVGGFDPTRADDNALCKWRSQTVGFIFQRYHLLPVLNAAQNIEVPLLLFNLPKSERNRRVRTALELVGLAQRGQYYPRQLSGGQEQRVAIARCIVTDPSLILADEPTGNLDSKSAGEIMDLLVLLNQQLRKTIVMVTHDPNSAKRAGRTLRLEKGLLR